MTRALVLCLMAVSIVSTVQSQFSWAPYPSSEQGWRHYFEMKEDAHPVEGIYSRSWKRFWNCDGGVHRNGIDSDKWVIIQGKNGRFYSIEIGDPNGGVLSFGTTATDAVFEGDWTYSSGRKANTMIISSGNAAMLEYSYNKPIAEVRSGWKGSWQSRWNSCVMRYDITLIRVFPAIKSKNTSSSSASGSKVQSGTVSSGSGIFIGSNGIVATNHHVIDGARSIKVSQELAGLRIEYNATVAVADAANDLALLRVSDSEFSPLPKLNYKLCGNALEKGSKVYAFGYPMALSGMGTEVKITDGMINALSGFDGDVKSYQMSAPIQPGNSGGPLFDENGNLVGINAAGLDKGSADNVGYSVKSMFLGTLIDASGLQADIEYGCSNVKKSPVELVRSLSSSVVMVVCEN